MATFLELCRRLASESGTVSGSGQPASVTGNTGRLEKIVNWVVEAWRLIQTQQSSWDFRRIDFQSNLLVGTSAYTAASFSISNFSNWVQDTESFTLYDPSLGVGDESVVRYLDWKRFKLLYLRGVQVSAKPVYYTVDQNRRILFGPLPDKAYIVKGSYIRSPQILAANNDVPICPEEFHSVIVWRALMLLAEHDEADYQRQQANIKFKEVLSTMGVTELPEMRISGTSLA